MDAARVGELAGDADASRIGSTSATCSGVTRCGHLHAGDGGEVLSSRTAPWPPPWPRPPPSAAAPRPSPRGRLPYRPGSAAGGGLVQKGRFLVLHGHARGSFHGRTADGRRRPGAGVTKYRRWETAPSDPGSRVTPDAGDGPPPDGDRGGADGRRTGAVAAGHPVRDAEPGAAPRHPLLHPDRREPADPGRGRAGRRRPRGPAPRSANGTRARSGATGRPCCASRNGRREGPS